MTPSRWLARRTTAQTASFLGFCSPAPPSWGHEPIVCSGRAVRPLWSALEKTCYLSHLCSVVDVVRGGHRGECQVQRVTRLTWFSGFCQGTVFPPHAS